MKCLVVCSLLNSIKKVPLEPKRSTMTMRHRYHGASMIARLDDHLEFSIRVCSTVEIDSPSLPTIEPSRQTRSTGNKGVPLSISKPLKNTCPGRQSRHLMVSAIGRSAQAGTILLPFRVIPGPRRWYPTSHVDAPCIRMTIPWRGGSIAVSDQPAAVQPHAAHGKGV